MTGSGLVILLHGIGGSGANMAGLGASLASALPGAIFESPNGPLSRGSGYAWYDNTGITAADRPKRVSEARASFDATITVLLEKHGFSNAMDKVALVGFSQGSVMALDAVASGRWQVGGVVALSGRLVTPLPLAPCRSPILLWHGEADGTIASSESVRAAERLNAAGAPVEITIEPNLGHKVSPSGLTHAAAFLRRVLGSAAPA